MSLYIFFYQTPKYLCLQRLKSENKTQEEANIFKKILSKHYGTTGGQKVAPQRLQIKSFKV